MFKALSLAKLNGLIPLYIMDNHAFTISLTGCMPQLRWIHILLAPCLALLLYVYHITL